MDKNDKEYLELKDSIKQWVDMAIEEDLNSNPKASRKYSSFIIAGISGALVLVLAIASGMALFNSYQCSEWEEVCSSYGENKSVALSDGSTICLHNDSRILFPSRFVGRYRQVFTSGEVYADIAKNKRHPFILSSDGVNVKVKGTKFNYRAYSGSSKVELALVEGAVEMSINSSGIEKVIELEAGTGVKFDMETGDMVQYSFKTDDSYSWTNAKPLYFNNLTLEEIAFELERAFGCKIVITSDKLKSSRFYASFLDVKSTEQVLDALCSTNMMQVSKSGENTYIISESKL